MMLPAALIKPAVDTLPCIALPVVDINPALKILPPVTLPPALAVPPVAKLPPVTVWLAAIPTFVVQVLPTVE